MHHNPSCTNSFRVMYFKAPTLGARASPSFLVVSDVIILWIWQQSRLIDFCHLTVSSFIYVCSGFIVKLVLTESVEVPFKNSTQCSFRASICCQGESFRLKEERNAFPYCLSIFPFFLYVRRALCLAWTYQRNVYSEKFNNETYCREEYYKQNTSRDKIGSQSNFSPSCGCVQPPMA